MNKKKKKLSKDLSASLLLEHLAEVLAEVMASSPLDGPSRARDVRLNRRRLMAARELFRFRLHACRTRLITRGDRYTCTVKSCLRHAQDEKKMKKMKKRKRRKKVMWRLCDRPRQEPAASQHVRLFISTASTPSPPPPAFPMPPYTSNAFPTHDNCFPHP